MHVRQKGLQVSLDVCKQHTSQHCSIPDGGSLSKRHITNDCCTGRHKGTIANCWQLSSHPQYCPVLVYCTCTASPQTGHPFPCSALCE